MGDDSPKVLVHVTWYQDKIPDKRQLEERWVYCSSQLKDSLHPAREGVAAAGVVS